MVENARQKFWVPSPKTFSESYARSGVIRSQLHVYDDDDDNDV